MLKANMNTEKANDLARQGKLGSAIQAILAGLKPEAAYFYEEDGERTGFIVFDMKESSEIPGIAEPWFLAFNAKITLRPAMTPQDLAAGLPGMEKAVKAYGKSAGA